MPSRDEWLLMALAHRRGAPLTPVQVQKAMFLMAMEAKPFVGTGFYHFVPYNYGPFDHQIYRDLEKLQREGLVTLDQAGGNGVRRYFVTPEGLERGLRLAQTTDGQAVQFLNKVVDWVASLSFDMLVRSIYAKYPNFRVNSVFQS